MTKKDLLKLLENVPDEALLGFQDVEQCHVMFDGKIEQSKIYHVTKDMNGKECNFSLDISDQFANKVTEKTVKDIFIIL